MLLNFGQPFGGIVQYGYVVEDIEKAMLQYVETLGVGPWHVIGPFVPADGMYRGKPTGLEVTLAIAFSGHIMIELIQQHNREPSVYLETVEKKGYGFHHFAVVSRNFDRDIDRYCQGHQQVVFTDKLLGSRIAYVDTTSSLPGMLEVVEWSPEIESMLTAIYSSAQNWDGSEPIRQVAMP